jgi:predicted enzyme related to lactoylglutathione lyase
MTHPVVWFEVMGASGDALRQFYGSLFDWTFSIEGPARYGITNTGQTRGIPGGVGQATDGHGRHGVTFYVETPDIAATLAGAERLGGKTLMPRTETPDVTLAMFADPEGHVIGLVEAKPA